MTGSRHFISARSDLHLRDRARQKKRGRLEIIVKLARALKIDVGKLMKGIR